MLDWRLRNVVVLIGVLALSELRVNQFRRWEREWVGGIVLRSSSHRDSFLLRFPAIFRLWWEDAWLRLVHELLGTWLRLGTVSRSSELMFRVGALEDDPVHWFGVLDLMDLILTDFILNEISLTSAILTYHQSSVFSYSSAIIFVSRGGPTFLGGIIPPFLTFCSNSLKEAAL